MVNEVTFEIIEEAGGGYRADAVGYPIHTFGRDRNEVRAMIQDAVDCYFIGPEGPPPTSITLRFVHEEVLAR